ncbi:MAG: type II toxin-antitoxin system HicA family toxin [Gloeobacterales cyanobacterium]
MTSTLPVLSGREVVRIFESFGWEFARQSASHTILLFECAKVASPPRIGGPGGAILRCIYLANWYHIIMVKEGELVTLSIPDHRELVKGTLRSLIRTAGLTVQEFVSAI